MPEGLIVPGAASEIEDGLMTVFRAAVKKEDATGAALVAQELRARAAATKINTRSEEMAVASHQPLPRAVTNFQG